MENHVIGCQVNNWPYQTFSLHDIIGGRDMRWERSKTVPQELAVKQIHLIYQLKYKPIK